MARFEERFMEGVRDVVRIGQRLGLMSSVGMVVRHGGDSHRPNRWSLPREASVS